MADGALLEPNGCSSLMLECPKAEYLLNGSKQLADEIQERPDKRFDCVGQDFKCCLQVSLHETILQVSKRLGKLMKCPSSELVLICKGKVVSSHPMFSLEALDLFDSSSTCKLLVLQRPPGPAWIPFSRGGHPSAARHPPPPPSSDLAAALPALRAPAGLRARNFSAGPLAALLALLSAAPAPCGGHPCPRCPGSMSCGPGCPHPYLRPTTRTDRSGPPSPLVQAPCPL